MSDNIDPQKYFYSKTIKTPSCWIWVGYNNGRGYGKFHSGKNFYYAHRFSYEIHKGEIPKGKNILHLCDNPSCVNPNHLILGTQKDNMADCSNKGRNFHGERNNLSKIKRIDAMLLRKEYQSFKYGWAEKLGISPGQVENIIRRNSWKFTQLF